MKPEFAPTLINDRTTWLPLAVVDRPTDIEPQVLRLPQPVHPDLWRGPAAAHVLGNGTPNRPPCIQIYILQLIAILH